MVQHMSNTDHIKACRNAYQSHLDSCQECTAAVLCKPAVVLLDELCCSMTANRNVEVIVVDESTNPTEKEFTCENQLQINL